LASIAQLDQAPVDELDRADIDAASRLPDQEHRRIALDLAGEYHLLLIASGKVCGLQQAVRGADVVFLDAGVRLVPNCLQVKKGRTAVAAIAVVAEDRVLVLL